MAKLNPDKLFPSYFNTKKQIITAFAPMEPITANPIVRELSGIHGAQLLFRPKILPQHLLQAKKWQRFEKIKKLNKLRTPNGKKIFDGIQIIARPDDPISQTVKYIDSRSNQMGIHFIDLNFCCPGYKVLPEKRGGELLKYPDLILKVISKVLKSTSLPVSLKIRKGYEMKDNPKNLCKKIFREFSDNIAWISVNRAPVKMQGVKMEEIRNDLEPFKDAVEGVENSIPILANGAIFNIEDYNRIVNNTQVKGIMIGRGALGNPNIFTQISNYQITKDSGRFVSLNKKFNDLFIIAKKYTKDESGRWCSFGNFKLILYYYIKYHFNSKNQQIPKGFGFSSFIKGDKLTPQELVKNLNRIFSDINSEKWKNWLGFLFS